MQRMNVDLDERAVSLLRGMLEIPSPSRGESALAAFLEREAASFGMKARRDEVGNVIAETGTGVGPTILLLSHMDTAGGPLPVRHQGGRLHGRGAVDAKGPLAAMISAASRQPEFPGRLIVAAVVEEETAGSRGANHLVQTMVPPSAVVVGEPSGWTDVVIGYKGQLALTYEVSRPPTHSTNPIEKATEALVAFWRHLQTTIGEAPPGPSFQTATATLLEMGGDMTKAHARIDVRTPLAFDAEALVDALRAGARGGELRVMNRVAAVRVERRDPVVRALTAAIRSEGGTPGYKLKTATSDMNTVAPHWHVPMATYGPGDSALDHGSEENIEIADFLRAIRVLGEAVRDLSTDPACAERPS